MQRARADLHTHTVTHTHTRTYTHSYTHTHTRTHTLSHKRACMWKNEHIHARTHTYTHSFAITHVHIYLSICLSIYLSIYLQIKAYNQSNLFNNHVTDVIDLSSRSITNRTNNITTSATPTTPNTSTKTQYLQFHSSSQTTPSSDTMRMSSYLIITDCPRVRCRTWPVPRWFQVNTAAPFKNLANKSAFYRRSWHFGWEVR